MQNRSTFIDTIKGIGIVLVVWGHCGGAPLTNQIYRFHIPLFFFLAGMFHKQQPLTPFVWHKTQRLLKPYVLFFMGSVVFNWLIRLVLAFYKSFFDDPTHSEVAFAWPTLWQIIDGTEKLTYNVPLWYLLCLCVTSIFYFFVLKIKNQWLQHGLVLAASVVGYWLFRNHINIRYHIDSVFTSMVFYHIGYVSWQRHWATHFTEGLRNQVLIMAVGIIVFMFLDSFAGDIDVRTNTIGSPYWVFLGESLAGIIIIYITGKIIDKTLIFRNLGQNTLAILCLHTPVFILTDIILTKLTPITLLSLTGSVFRLTLTLCLCVLLIRFYETITLKLESKINVKKA
jgi:acyltransferase